MHARSVPMRGNAVRGTRQPRVVLSWEDVAVAAEGLDPDLRELLKGLIEDHLPDSAGGDHGAPVGPWFLRGLRVQGHVGIGKAPLDLTFPPTAGIIVISARNGTGKTSTADGLRHVLSGGTARKYELAEDNVHFGERSIQVIVTNGAEEIEISCAGTGTVQWLMPDGAERPVPKEWDRAFVRYNPVLLYPEISPVIEKPSRLHDFLKDGLSLDVLTELLDTVDRVRKAAKSAQDRIKPAYDATLSLLRKLERTELLAKQVEVCGPTPAVEVAAKLTASVASLPTVLASRPELVLAWTVDDVVAEQCRSAVAELQAARVAVVPGAEAVQVALERLVQADGYYLEGLRADDVCPVCTTAGVSWFEVARCEAERLGSDLRVMREADGAVRTQLRRLDVALPGQLAADTRKVLQEHQPEDCAEFISMWDWLASHRSALKPETITADLVLKLCEESARVAGWYSAVRARILAEYDTSANDLARVRQQVDLWLDVAEKERSTCSQGPHAEKLAKTIEQWVKDTRSALFAPIAARVVEIWKELNSDSDLDVRSLQLGGGTRQAGKVAMISQLAKRKSSQVPTRRRCSVLASAMR